MARVMIAYVASDPSGQVGSMLAWIAGNLGSILNQGGYIVPRMITIMAVRVIGSPVACKRTVETLISCHSQIYMYGRDTFLPDPILNGC